MNQGVLNRIRSITVQLEREDLIRENEQLKKKVAYLESEIAERDRMIDLLEPKPKVRKAIPGGAPE